MKEKTIAVSTFCSWTSYGSILQAYALKQTLNKLGYSSYILIDRFVPTPQTKCRIPLSKNIKAVILGYLNHLLLGQVTEQYTKSNAFIRNNIDIIYYNNYRELALNYYKADYYLAGSDQVFNPNNLQRGFYFDYIKDKSKRLTYACSMGTTKIAPDKEELFALLVNNFSKISVREEDNISVLKKYNPNVEYCVNIDPTFLLDADEWRAKEKAYDVQGKYILVYPLYWDKHLNQELKQLHKKTGIKIIGVFSSGYNTIYCNEKLYNVGVDEFLWLIDHAEAVITSSFHGAAFSTIFKKKLCLVSNPAMPSRLNNLIDVLGLHNCEIKDVLEKVEEYDKLASLIKAEQEKSNRYLKEILNVK